MSNSVELLKEKLENFKQFVKENADADKQDEIKKYENMGFTQLLIFAKFFLVSYENDLTEIVETISERTGIKDVEKLEKYLKCFITLCKQC